MGNILNRCFWLWAAVFAFAAVAWGAAPLDWQNGIGVSALEDPRAAGEEAAGKAKAGLAGKQAKFVMVTAAEPQVTEELIEGVAAHFDRSIIYGCQVTSPLTPETNFPAVKTIDVPVGVGVWALAGDMDVETFTVKTNEEHEDIYYEAGVEMGDLLKPALEASSRPGKIVLTFGDQYNGSNIDYMLGMNDALEETYPVIGAAAGNITAKEIVQGDIVTGTNVGVVIAGNFKVGQAMNGGTHTPETADKTLAFAVEQGDGAEPHFALIFNCRRRRQGMIERDQLGEELVAMRKNLPTADFFGFYGPGEVGASANGEKAKGVGFTVVAAVFFPAD